MSEYRFILEAGKKKKYRCPGCGKDRKFVRYVDEVTKDLLPEKYGRCDREVECAYHVNPYHDGYNKTGQMSLRNPIAYNIPKSVKPIDYFPFETLKESCKYYHQNNFVRFLHTKLTPEQIDQILYLYKIGTSKYWPGGTIFWQIDINGNARYGKIMLYSLNTGKRVKEPHSHIVAAHAALKLKEFNFKQCFFGEHNLNLHPDKTVAIVESEKTACICSAYFPKYLWLATGMKGGLNEDKCKVLKGRKVVLFPDVNAFEDWNKKAKELSHITSFVISDLLEKNANDDERKQGADLADFLLKYETTDFNN